MSEYVLYILMRTDLPSMGPGRACAQASHAANAFWKENQGSPEARKWAASTAQGFGTAIVLSVNGNTLDQKITDADALNFPSRKVIDPDYVITVPSELKEFLVPSQFSHVEDIAGDARNCLFHRREITCGYVFGTKESLKSILGDLPLYPG